MRRLASGVLAGALIRRANQAGGTAMVLARGDPEAGALLVLALERGANPRFFERGLDERGETALVRAGPRAFESDADVTEYWQRRRARDPDLWVIEVDAAAAERLAAETIVTG